MLLEIAAGCVVASSSPIARCRCVEIDQFAPSTLREYTDTAHATFVGRAVSVRTVRDTFAYGAIETPTGFVRGEPILSDFFEYTIAMSRSWGAPARDTITVRTVTQPTMCGATIALTADYLFMARRNPAGRLYVDRCVPPVPAGGAAGAIQALNRMASARRGAGAV